MTATTSRAEKRGAQSDESAEKSRHNRINQERLSDEKSDCRSLDYVGEDVGDV